MKTRTLIALGLCLVLATTACAANSAGLDSGRDRNRITLQEIQESDALNAYELVQRLRPRWLRVRGQMGRSLNMETRILVYFNNSRLGTTEQLRQISLEPVVELRFLDAAQATSQLPGIGSEHVAGAVVVSTVSSK